MSENNDIKQDLVREKIISLILTVKEKKQAVLQISGGLLLLILGTLYYNDSNSIKQKEVKSLLGQAQNLYIDSQIDNAVDDFNRVLNEYSGTESEQIAKLYLAMDYINNDLNDDAFLLLEELSTSLNDDILRSSVLNMLGNNCLDNEDYKEALNYFKIASSIHNFNSFNDDYSINIAKTYKYLNDYESAIDVLNKLLKKDDLKFTSKNDAEQLKAEINVLLFNKTN
tara:strand:- start:7618 stop:8295 length:678 start_codon:yes stop_codon:yes gene_type:complete